jgi:hypothetical protein
MDALIAGLRNLTVRTKAGQMRALMPVIEERLTAGVAQQDIVSALRESGIDMTLGTFKSYLHRHRVKTRSQLSSSSQIKSEPVPSEPNPSKTTAPVDTDPVPIPEDALDAESIDGVTENWSLAEMLDRKEGSAYEAHLDRYMNRRRPLFGRNRG